MPADVQRVFQALTGEEVKEIILREIRAKLDSDEHFEPHLTFPVIQWTWTLETTAYPVSEEHMQLAVKGEIHNQHWIEELKKGPPHLVIMKGERNVSSEGQAPDQARSESDLPVPEAVVAPGVGITFDQMEKPKRTKK